jgi:RHS repeat-associated protein
MPFATYDPYNQLGLVGGMGESYAYDLNGNRTVTDILNPLEIANRSYNNVNEIVGATYDPNGNVLSPDGVTTYKYDDFGRVISRTTGAQSTAFNYDGLGRLIQVVDTTPAPDPGHRFVVANHTYVWCGGVRCVQYDNQNLDSNGRPTVSRVYVQQGLMEGGSGGVPFYYVTDQLGSVRELVDDSQPPVVIARYQYDSLGDQTRTVTNGHGNDSDIGFAGYFRDAPKGTLSYPLDPVTARGATLYFATNRAYSPGLGRWLTRDPIGSSIAFWDPARFNATDLNLYAYAGNSPLSATDPTGNCPACIGGVVGFAAGAIWYAATAPTNLSWSDFASGATAYGTLGAAAGASGAALGILAGGGTLADALGLGVAGGGAVGIEVIPPKTLEHIFDNPGHNLAGLVQQLGSREAAYQAILAATQAALQSQQLTGVFRIVVSVSGVQVTVKGAVVNGVCRISTAFIP